MSKDLAQWIAHVEAVRQETDALAQRLAAYGATVVPERRNVVGELPYLAQFRFGDAVTTIRFLLKDYQTDSDVVITDMTTLPDECRRQGYGSQAVRALLQWAAANDLKEIRATQVGNRDNEPFWEKNGFRKCPAPNPCNDFVRPSRE